MRRCRLCDARVIAPRSSRPRGQVRRLHHQRLCGSIIPTFGLRGYVSELLFTVTTLLVDRSLGNLGLRRIKFLLFASNPNTFMKKAYTNTDHSHHKLPQKREEDIRRRRSTSFS
jgi:hypothetical protein